MEGNKAFLIHIILNEREMRKQDYIQPYKSVIFKCMDICFASNFALWYCVVVCMHLRLPIFRKGCTCEEGLVCER